MITSSINILRYGGGIAYAPVPVLHHFQSLDRYRRQTHAGPPSLPYVSYAPQARWPAGRIKLAAAPQLSNPKMGWSRSAAESA